MQPIKTALLSYGMSGRIFHAPFLQTVPGFAFYAAWERSKRTVQEKFPAVKSVATLEELLADEAVELVIVNTPNYTHYTYAKQALQAGKHVVVEKPFVTTAAEGEELIALAGQRGCLLSVYHNRRWDSDYKTVTKVVREGWLGNVVEAEFHFDRYNQSPSVKAHKETPGPGTGIVFDLGSHLIDQALHLFGQPQAVFADVQTQRPAAQVDDYCEILFYYPSLRVRLHAGYTVREAVPGYAVHGTNGSFVKTKADVQEETLDKGVLPGGDAWGAEPADEQGLLHTERNGAVIRQRIPTEKGSYQDYFAALYNAVRNGAPLPVTADEGLAVVRLVQAAHQSSRERCVIAL